MQETIIIIIIRSLCFLFLPVHHQNTTTIIVPILMGLLLRYERGEIRNQNAVAKLLNIAAVLYVMAVRVIII